MKRIRNAILLIIGLWQTVNVRAQSPVDAKQLMTKADNAKSMTRQQDLTNFLQAVASNLTSTTTSAQLKASIFALDGMDSAKKYTSKYYLDHTWERHTQVIVGGGLDANSNFNSITIGGSFDFLHHNDVSEVDSYSDSLKPLTEALNRIEAEALTQLIADKQNEITPVIIAAMKMATTENTVSDLDRAILKPLVCSRLRDSIIQHDKTFKSKMDDIRSEVQIASNTGRNLNSSAGSIALLANYISALYFATPVTQDFLAYLYSIMQNGSAPSGGTTPNQELLDAYTRVLDSLIAKDPVVYHGKNLVAVYNYIETNYKLTIARIKLRPALTLNYNYTYNIDSVQNQHAASLVFQWGFGRNPNRAWSLQSSLGDSATTDTTHLTAFHNKFSFSPGISKVFASDKDGNALLELGVTSEFDLVSSALYTGEKRFNWLPTATLQARPTAKSPWISIVVKKDVDKGNLLGFLNITFNLANPSGSSN